MKFNTKCLHSGYSPRNGEPDALPICKCTTFRYGSTKEVGKLFDLEEDGFFYTRLGNPTVNAVEEKIAALEGGVGALCVSSGQSANFVAVMNLLQCGDHIVSSRSIYGGSSNLFAVTLKRMGISVTFVDNQASDDEIRKAIRPETKLVFGETISNPTICVFDIERFAKIAHENGLPLIVDNTFATPYLCRPIEWGADIVTHSTSKYLDGHAVQLGGAVVDSGKFDWSNGKFPEFTEPDESYHGVVYTKKYGNAAYIAKARNQLLRDLGCCMTPDAAFQTNIGIETLGVRMKRHCENAEAAAEFLSSLDAVESVNYPTVKGNAYAELAKKYLPSGSSGVISFTLKGGRAAGIKFIDSLKLISLLVHVADIRSCVLHPASSTHRQLSDKELELSGVGAGLIRFSVGLEDIDDIKVDLLQAIEASQR